MTAERKHIVARNICGSYKGKTYEDVLRSMYDVAVSRGASLTFPEWIEYNIALAQKGYRIVLPPCVGEAGYRSLFESFVQRDLFDSVEIG